MNIVNNHYSCWALLLGMYVWSFLLRFRCFIFQLWGWIAILSCLHDAIYLQSTHIFFAWMTDISAISYYMFHILIGVLSWFPALEPVLTLDLVFSYKAFVVGQLQVEHHFPNDPKYFNISNWQGSLTCMAVSALVKCTYVRLPWSSWCLPFLSQSVNNFLSLVIT